MNIKNLINQFLKCSEYFLIGFLTIFGIAVTILVITSIYLILVKLEVLLIGSITILIAILMSVILGWVIKTKFKKGI